MNKENASKLWKIIQEANDYLLGYMIPFRMIINNKKEVKK